MPLINQISVPRFSSLLSKIFGIKERDITPTLGTEILPTFNVQDARAPELYFTKGERILGGCMVPFMWGATVTAVHPVIAFGNPTNSNTLITVEKIKMYPALDGDPYNAVVKLDYVMGSPFAPANVAGEPINGVIFPGFPGALAAADWDENFMGVWRDGRWFNTANLGGNLGHVMRFFVANKLAAVGSLGGSNIWSQVSASSNQAISTWIDVFEEVDWVLSPGQGVRIFCTHRAPVGISIKWEIQWRERPLEDSEVRAGSS